MNSRIRFICFGSICLVVSVAQGQNIITNITWALSNAPYETYYLGSFYGQLVSSTTGDFEYIPTEDGVYFSEDYGATWSGEDAGSCTDPDYEYQNSCGIGLLAATSTSGQYVYSCQYDISSSSDYGTSFVRAGFNANWGGIDCDATGQHIVAVNYFEINFDPGSIYISNDFGDTWTQTSAIQAFWNGVTTDATFQYQVAVILDGNIYTSSNSGVDWSISPGAGTDSWQGVTSSASGAYVFAYSLTNIYVSSDYGQTWTTPSSAVVSGSPYTTWTDVTCDSTGQYLIAATGTKLYYVSSDFGTNWYSSTFTGGTHDYPVNMLITPDAERFLATTGNEIWYGIYSTRPPTLSPTVNPTSSPPTMEPTMPTSKPSSNPTQPTSRPSSQPTSMPSCPIGDGHVGGGGCEPCQPGYYSNNLGFTCTACPKNTKSTSSGATECENCPYPSTTFDSGASSCDGFSLNDGITTTSVVFGTLVFITVLCIASGEKRVVILMNLFFPTLDVFSDLAYLLTNDFYSPILFGFGVLFIIFPVPTFLYKLYYLKAWPVVNVTQSGVFWLRAGREEAQHGDSIYYAQFPCFGNNGRFPVLSCVRHENLLYLILEGFVWIIAIVCQILTLALVPVYIVGNVLLHVLWLFLGIFLLMTKTLAIGRVWNLWFRFWTASSAFDTDVDVDTKDLNTYLHHEFYYESVPQFIVQVINAFLMKQLSPLAIFSFSQSIIMSLNGCWRYVYFRYFLTEPMELEHIPIEMSIHIKIACLGIDKVIVDGKLEPMAKTEDLYNRESVIISDKKIDRRPILRQSELRNSESGGSP